MADTLEDETMLGDAEIEADSLDRESTNLSTEDDIIATDGNDEKQGGTRLAQLPHTRVRNMMKLDSDLHIASQDSVFLVTKAAVCECMVISFVSNESAGLPTQATLLSFVLY